MSQPLGSCPVCKQEIRPGEDMVVCPDCGTPYHRECYAKEGRCVHADKHASGYEYTSPGASAAATGAAGKAAGPGERSQVQCANCGATNNAQGIFCESCGAPLYGPQREGAPHQGQQNAGPFGGGFGSFGGAYIPPQQDLSGEIDGISKKDWNTYIGPSAPMYIQRMAIQQQRGRKLYFLVSAFLFPQYYFSYRKMWGWAAASVLLMLVGLVPDVFIMLYQTGVGVIPGYTLSDYDSLVTGVYIISIILQLVLGMFSVYLYRQNAGKRIKKLREEHPGEEAYQNALRKKGGTSIAAVALVFLLFMGVVMFLQYGLGLDVVSYYIGAF